MISTERTRTTPGAQFAPVWESRSLPNCSEKKATIPDLEQIGLLGGKWALNLWCLVSTKMSHILIKICIF